MGYAAESVYHYFEEGRYAAIVGTVVLMREDRRSVPTMDGEAVISSGTRTTAQNKPQMIEALSAWLRSGTLCFYKNFVVSDPDNFPANADHPRIAIVKELKGFVMEIQYKSKNANPNYQRPVIRYRGYKGNDRTDFVMCLAIVTLQARLFLTSDKYAHDRVGR